MNHAYDAHPGMKLATYGDEVHAELAKKHGADLIHLIALVEQWVDKTLTAWSGRGEAFQKSRYSTRLFYKRQPF